jgi:anionic cell wall polymer biosynthesis LytR-Cps2A-Psr (LCP) family protein
LPYPAPGGHLIRQFGGSDKEQIDNSSSEPNTTQVLNLLNGFVETNILNKKDASFIKQMQSENSKTKQIESVFLSILSRKPNSTEINALKKLIDKKDGFKHVAWILLNSHEFIFIK